MRTTTPAPLARVAALLTLLLVPAAMAQRVTDPDAGNQPRRLESPNLDRIFELNPADAPIESDARVIDSYNKHGFEWSFNVSNPSKDYGPAACSICASRPGSSMRRRSSEAPPCCSAG